MPATTAQNAIAAVGIDIGKNSFHTVARALCRQQLGQGAGGLRRGDQAPPRIRLTIRQRARVLRFLAGVITVAVAFHKG
jgi:hypothetical protein